MNTQLDERQELINKIELLCPADIQKVRVFIAGVEAGRATMTNACQAAKSGVVPGSPDQITSKEDHA